jgi:hypothetical protein
MQNPASQPAASQPGGSGADSQSKLQAAVAADPEVKKAA